ncbi:MAG TPA: hypothetical protein P5556_09840 [Candidatus Gastranaerophilales bacterium]|nr:hypothetical protein [Candidatus Gastranaerophilales bacterium]
MKKIIFIVIMSIFLITACDREKDAVILLGNEQIDPSNFVFQNTQPVFKPRQKIYYILVTKEPIESEELRIQVLKLDQKYPAYKIEVAYGRDINRGSQKNYVTDYFILHKEGNYVIRIFSHDNFDKPISETEFLVEPL